MTLLRTAVAVLALVALGLCRPQSPNSAQPPAALTQQNKTVATILKSEFENHGDGSFKWEIETSDGFKAEQSGVTEPGSVAKSDLVGGAASDEAESGGGEVVKGSYSYTAPNGELISVTYVADKNGFQPVGSHIPTPPPNPFSNNASSVQHV